MLFHLDAFREIVLNAIVHKDYAERNPIQISVYPDRIYVWNDGSFPPGLDTSEKLFGKHSSKPFNPLLAGVFFKCGLIEAWGRGFDKIAAGCKEYGGALPTYDIGEAGVMVKCEACPAYLALLEGSRGHQAADVNATAGENGPRYNARGFKYIRSTNNTTNMNGLCDRSH